MFFFYRCTKRSDIDVANLTLFIKKLYSPYYVQSSVRQKAGHKGAKEIKSHPRWFFKLLVATIVGVRSRLNRLWIWSWSTVKEFFERNHKYFFFWNDKLKMQNDRKECQYPKPQTNRTIIVSNEEAQSKVIPYFFIYIPLYFSYHVLFQ
jgi:hypothetical protein